MPLRSVATAFDRVVRILSVTLALFAGALLAMLYIIVQFEVVMRFVFHAPTHWTHEVSTFAISWVGLMAAPYALRLGSQLEVDLVVSRLSPRSRARLGIATDLLGAAFCGFAAWLGLGFVEIAQMMEATSASELDTPLWIPYLVIPIAFSALCLEFLARALTRAGLVAGRAPAAEVQHV
ncbi:TRAP transporter small permease [Falsiroseomonas sp.]|uniref:TRAP transporter small permease n=1 Tax=Falsiroseomonas sp. TaxID=2870721 RepID=UPI003563933A